MNTRKDLESALGGLLEAFPTAFNAARMERISAILYGLSLQDIKRLGEHLLDSSRYAPLPEDFKKAISDLSLKRKTSDSRGLPPTRKKLIDIALIEGDWFFDSFKVFRRGKPGQPPAFIYRDSEPDHSLVIKAAEKEKLCLAGKARFIPGEDLQTNFIPTEEDFDFFYGKPVNSFIQNAIN